MSSFGDCESLVQIPRISLRENRSKIVFRNPRCQEVRKVQIDDCVIKKGRRCDYLLINEEDIGRVSVGNSARVMADIGDEMLARGEITAIGLVPRMVHGTSNYPVQVSLSSQAEGVMPGMAVRVVIEAGELGNAVRLDRQALLWRTGGWHALRVESGKARPVAVEVGPAIGGDVTVLSGVSDGDVILANPGEQGMRALLGLRGGVAEGGAQ